MRPIIGIVPLWDSERHSIWMLPGYTEWIEAAGGVPLLLPFTQNKDVLASAMKICQGFLLTGGQDVSPGLYGEEALPECGESCEIRDVMERDLLLTAIAEDKPVFGICRGIQFLNVYCGGTLWQDIPSQHPTGVEHHMSPPYARAVHEVSILPDSPLHQILGCSTLAVNSYHHQAVKTIGNGLQAAAVSEDGFVESLYMPGKRFVLAVQWHPELRSDAASQKLFSAFVKAAIG